MGKRAMLSALVKARLGGWTAGLRPQAVRAALLTIRHFEAAATRGRRRAVQAGAPGWPAPLRTAATGYLLTPLCQQVKGFLNAKSK